MRGPYGQNSRPQGRIRVFGEGTSGSNSHANKQRTPLHMIKRIHHLHFNIIANSLSFLRLHCWGPITYGPSSAKILGLAPRPPNIDAHGNSSTKYAGNEQNKTKQANKNSSVYGANGIQ